MRLAGMQHPGLRLRESFKSTASAPAAPLHAKGAHSLQMKLLADCCCRRRCRLLGAPALAARGAWPSRLLRLLLATRHGRLMLLRCRRRRFSQLPQALPVLPRSPAGGLLLLLLPRLLRLRLLPLPLQQGCQRRHVVAR